ncbi:fibronectin type III domain-containing protein [Lactobacillus sp. LL6]|uniref:fibronectin type III domain-containing protein n=1 Tax=Lactobacillus sp. LL6 TaxID=2596827 RepID=UPI0011857135|nr:fibronectin type III domain-containing protein [Lactobacillus sp. LL6]TSO25703.1 fibronectin type III domain-containing protein [Lactobacillus sp. LL6]
MKKKSIITFIATSLVVLGLASQNASAATTSQLPMDTAVTVQKDKTYKLYFKQAGRLRVKNGTQVSLKNNKTWNWTLEPYSAGKNYTEYYLRKGTYYLTADSSAKISMNFVALTKIRKNLETFGETRKHNNNAPSTANKIQLGQAIKGFTLMYNYDNPDYYTFTLTKPQKVTMDISNSPIYQKSKHNITTKMRVSISTGLSSIGTTLTPSYVDINGRTNKKITWYLAKGTYTIDLANLYGRYNFQLTGSEDTDNNIPAETEIKSIKKTSAGLEVSLKEAANADYYRVVWRQKGTKSAVSEQASSTLTVTIPFSKLKNDTTYEFAAQGIHGENYVNYGSTMNHDYYYGPMTDWSYYSYKED